MKKGTGLCLSNIFVAMSQVRFSGVFSSRPVLVPSLPGGLSVLHFWFPASFP